MKSSYFKYCLLIASLVTTISFGGCSTEDDSYPVPGEEEIINDAKLILTVDPNGTATRANAIELEGTSEENHYSEVTVYFTDLEDKIITSIPHQTVSEKKTLIIQMDEQDIDLTKAMHIYLAANMNEVLSNGSNIHEAIKTIKDINEVTSNNKFLMLGQAFSNGSADITFNKGKFTSAVVVLTRVVAKVLVTASTDRAQGGEWVMERGKWTYKKYDKEDQKYIDYIVGVKNGFIRKENLRYVLQTTNSKVSYLPNAENKDPNYNMSELIQRENDSFKYIGDAGTDFFNKEKWEVSDENKGTPITEYNLSRLQEGSKDPYTEGIYCLENTTSDANGLSLTDAETETAPQMVTTYVRIAAKVTPWKINGENYEKKNIRDAEEAMGHNNGQQNYTFYIYSKAKGDDKEMCYTTKEKGIRLLKEKGYKNINEADFVEYTDGWVYFDVYVNGKSFDAQASSLIRNNYYIANIIGITVPFVEKTIEVNTTVATWKQGGRTNIDIETGN